MRRGARPDRGGPAVAPRPPDHGIPGQLPAPLTMLEADMVSFDCAVDGRCHLVDDRYHAEVHAAGGTGYHALCGRAVIADSMCVQQRPPCRDCLSAAAPRLAVVRGRHRAAERRSRWVLDALKGATRVEALGLIIGRQELHPAR